MGILDEVRASFGDDFFHPGQEREPIRRWRELCVCGHIDRYHSPSIGGNYRLAPTITKVLGGEEWTVGEEFYGCAGALTQRGFVPKTDQVDTENRTNILKVNPTCPCTSFRPVANVDRPNRYFNQRIPRNPEDRDRHPFLVGIRAFNTFLSGRVAARKDDRWAEREFDRRFTWLDRRVCSITHCKQTDVWPTFVNGDLLSELRCEQHR